MSVLAGQLYLQGTGMEPPSVEEALFRRIDTLRSEIVATQAKIERLHTVLARRQQKLNLLLAEAALNGTSARHHEP